MAPLLLTFVIFLCLAQLALPKRLGSIPLLVASCHIGNFELFSELTPARLIIIIGIARALATRSLKLSIRSRVDRTFIVFSIFALISGVGHDYSSGNPYLSRAGLILNVFGTYLYAKSYLFDIPSLRRLTLWLPLIILPLSIIMSVEKVTTRNAYQNLGLALHGGTERDGKHRATGPFRSPILAGTSGAAALPLCVSLWHAHPLISAIGVGSSLAIVYASTSSGPAAAMAAGVAFLAFFRYRKHLKKVQIITLLGLAAATVLMGRPVWYLMARIDIFGGSTGWHRAKLMDQGFLHLHEWWLFGTDYTRHWMATGVSWSPNHADITNYYLHLGVIGGIALPICLVLLLWYSFRSIGTALKQEHTRPRTENFLLWCAGTSLAVHAASFLSISYYDQMYVHFYLLIGAIVGLTDNRKRASFGVTTTSTTSSPSELVTRPALQR